MNIYRLLVCELVCDCQESRWLTSQKCQLLGRHNVKVWPGPNIYYIYMRQNIQYILHNITMQYIFYII